MISLRTIYTQRWRRCWIPIALALIVALPNRVGAKNAVVIRSIQSAITQVESEIMPLPELSLNPTPWTLGYRTWPEEVHKETFIRIHFATPTPIDMLALFPATYVPHSDKVAVFGFPVRFTIACVLKDGSTKLIADYSQRDYIVSGIEPQLFRLAEPVPAESILITILQHPENPTWWPTKYVAALSEIMAFSGDWNVALGAKVRTSSENRFGYIWNRNCLIDGFSLFSPASGELQDPFDNFYCKGENITLRVDLGETRTVDELRLWPVEHSNQHNFPHASGIEFPTHIRLEQLDEPSSTKGRTLFETASGSPKPGSGPLMRRFPPVQGRYFRLKLRDPVPDFRRNKNPIFALSEIELVEQGKVLTRGLSLTFEPSSRTNKNLPKLTDGRTTEGEILPLRGWVEDLVRRAALERQLVELRLDLRFAQQQERERLLFLILLALCVIPISAWLVKLMADRRWDRVRDRMACDLHDEIGANVSSLAHITELLKETIDEPSALQAQMLDNAIYTARLTSNETRNFIQLLEADKSGFDLTEKIGKVAQQILGSLDCTCEIEPNVALSRLRISRQWDLLLFVKEGLNNIIKHADASHVEILVCRRAERIQLTLADNGKGLPQNGPLPRHLQTRAKQLNADLKIESLPGEGTRILLTFK
jgi:signal transduction histidine kinase